MTATRPGETTGMERRIRIAAAGDVHAAAGESERVRPRSPGSTTPTSSCSRAT